MHFHYFFLLFSAKMGVTSDFLFKLSRYYGHGNVHDHKYLSAPIDSIYN